MDPLSAIIGLASRVLDKIWGNKDDELKRQFIFEMQKELNESQLLTKQIDVNTAEAANASVWVSGARPFVMWVCGCSFAWQFLLQPIITYLLLISGHAPIALPVFDYAALNTVLMGMLGIAGMRTYEKLKGVNDRHG